MKPFYVFQVSQNAPTQFRITVCIHNYYTDVPAIDEPGWKTAGIYATVDSLMAIVESYLSMEETK